MSSAAIAGAFILGVPLFLFEVVVLRKQPRAILLFSLALLVVGLGYLAAVGATADIARRVMPGQFPAAAASKA